MTQLLLEIPQRKDLDLLLALVERLNIRIVQQEETPGQSLTQLETNRRNRGPQRIN